MQNLNRQNNSNYNQLYTPSTNQYLYNKSKDIFQNSQNNNTRSFSPNSNKKNNTQDYHYMNKQEMPLKNSTKQNNQQQRNPQTYQNYQYQQNISDKSSSPNYFSPIPKQMPENINLQNFNIESKKFPTFSNYNPKKSKKTLILDLDETLVHSGFHPFNRKSDFTLNIKVDGKNHTIYVLKRPYVEEFLSEIAPYYEIIIFTASISEYASPLLDMLDKNKLTSGRLFRQHCLFNHGLYLKDIKIIQKDLKDVIIIDNNPVSYVMNQDNGLPILTWYDDLNDRELINFIPLLKYLSTEDDVREVIKKIVDKQTNKIKFDIVEELIKKKINENNKYKDMIYQTNDNYNKNSLSNNNPKNKNELNTNSNYNQNYINSNNYNDKKYEIKINNKFDVKQNYNIIKDEEKKIKNYFNNDNNFYKYNNYNKSIHDSLSNMTYNEIQNEGTINDEKEYNDDYNNYNNKNFDNNKNNINKGSQNYVIQKAINYDNHKHYEERNKINNYNKQNDLLKKENKNNEGRELGRQNNENYEYKINNLNDFKLSNVEQNQNKRNYSSNTYNPNTRKSNYKYNNSEQKYRQHSSIMPNEIKNINYELRYTNNNEIRGDKIYNVPRVSNYINENNKYLENITIEKEGKNENSKDNYLKLYQQQLLKLRMNENKYSNHNPTNNMNVNNIHIYQNKDLKPQFNQNLNYQNNNYNNNNINRNHSINSLNYRRNNMNYINFNNNMHNLNNFDHLYNERFGNDNRQNDLLKREEKIFKDKPKEFEEDNIQKTNTNLRFFKTQTNFMQHYKDRNNNNVFNINNSNQQNEFRFNNNFRRNNEDNQERIIQPKINNYFNGNDINRSFSDKKGFIINKESNIDLDRKARERKKYVYSPYYLNRKEFNEPNIRNINLNNNNMNPMKYMNGRNDTDVNKEKRNDNFSINNQEDKNNLYYTNKIYDYQRENNNYINNYNDKLNNLKQQYQNQNNNENNFKYSQKLSRTEDRKFYRSSSSKPYNNNNNYFYNNDNSRIPRNYNNININNYNFYNSFVDNNKDKPEENRFYNNKYRIQYFLNKEDEESNALNRSSSYFHPKPTYYSLLNQNGNSYTPNALKRNNLLKSKFLNNFGNYRAFE